MELARRFCEFINALPFTSQKTLQTSLDPEAALKEKKPASFRLVKPACWPCAKFSSIRMSFSITPEVLISY